MYTYLTTAAGSAYTTGVDLTTSVINTSLSTATAVKDKTVSTAGAVIALPGKVN